MCNCNSLNQHLSIYEKAKEEFLDLCNKIDQEILDVDTQHLLLPSEITHVNWTMMFDFSPGFKRLLYEKYTVEARGGYRGIDQMNRDELEAYIIDKELHIDTDEFKDEPLEKLLHAVKEEVGLINISSTRKIAAYECKFEVIGVVAWKPDDSETAVISVFIEMDSDDSTWPLVKKVAKAVGGKILLHCGAWEKNQIICASFCLTNTLDPKEIAKEVVSIAEKIMAMAAGK